MAAADWLKLRTEYVTGDISYRKLAAKYGVSFNSLQLVAKREKWPTLRRQHIDKTMTKIMEKETDKAAARYTRLMNVTDKLLAKIETAVDNLELESADKATLRAISASLKDIKEIQALRSDLDLQEQKARIKKLEREAEGENADRTVTFVLSDELMKYAE